MEVFLNGLYILNLYKGGIVVFFVSVLGLGVWGLRFSQIKDQEYLVQKLSLALCFGSILLISLSLVLVLFGLIWNPVLKFGSLLIPVLGSASLVLWFLRMSSRERVSSFIVFCILIIAILLVRLAFIKGILLPPYSDSPEHYMIVESFLSPGENKSTFYSFDTLTNRYYHFGFHVLAAWFSSTTGLDSAKSISLLGQLFLVILPVSVYLFAINTIKDFIAGFVAMSFAAFAWRMPAFASNWGKYPAIAGLSLFPAVIGLWILYYRNPEKKPLTIAILILMTATLVFVHTRLAICLGLVLISFLIVRKLPLIMGMNYWKASLLAILSITLFLPFRENLSVFYGNGYYLVLVLVALMLPFAFYRHPRLSIGIMLFSLGVWVVSHLSIFVEGYSTAWLDQPFIEILLSIPLSILGGVGFAGLLDRLQRPALRQTATVILSALIVFSFIFADSVYPDMCCNFVGVGDLEGIEWLEENTSQNAVIWTVAFKPGNYMIATDAGAWIDALTGRNVNKLDIDFEWSSLDALDTICRPGYEDVYIYRGSSSFSFSDETLEKQNWLAPVFASDGTKIYRVMVPCGN